MSYSAIVAKIKTRLDAVTGVGPVHGYARWAVNWDNFLSMFSESGKINGWTISRQSATMHRTAYSEVQKAHIFVLSGLYGLDDANNSEAVFNGLLDAVQTAFKGDPTLGGSAVTINPEVGPMAGLYGLQIELIENRLFGSVLCHFAECRLCAIETI
jgi:hypothetical protein